MCRQNAGKMRTASSHACGLRPTIKLRQCLVARSKGGEERRPDTVAHPDGMLVKVRGHGSRIGASPGGDPLAGSYRPWGDRARRYPCRSQRPKSNGPLRHGWPTSRRRSDAANRQPTGSRETVRGRPLLCGRLGHRHQSYHSYLLPVYGERWKSETCIMHHGAMRDDGFWARLTIPSTKD